MPDSNDRRAPIYNNPTASSSLPYRPDLSPPADCSESLVVTLPSPSDKPDAGALISLGFCPRNPTRRQPGLT
eukprot:gene1743-12785_t